MTAETITQFIAENGYVAVFLLIALENIFPPLPSELILTFAGALTTIGNFGIINMIIASTAGAILGALILYYVGRLLNRDTLNKLLSERIGKILGLTPEKLLKAENYFQTHGNKAVFFGRFVPLVRSLISLPAGMSKFNLKDFLIWTSLGTLIWNSFLIGAGHLAGNAYQTVINEYEHIVMPILVIICILVIAALFIKKKRKTK